MTVLNRVKHRKAYQAGKLAIGNELQYPYRAWVVVMTGWSLSLLHLLMEICRVPQSR